MSDAVGEDREVTISIVVQGFAMEIVISLSSPTALLMMSLIPAILNKHAVLMLFTYEQKNLFKVVTKS